jgi:hypothetical protein
MPARQMAADCRDVLPLLQATKAEILKSPY